MASQQVDLNRLRSWTIRRQMIDQAGSGTSEVLARCVAVYSSHPSAPLSIAARAEKMTTTDYAAIDRERLAVRVPAMRGSIFLVPLETVAQVQAATTVPLEKMAGRAKYGGFSWEEYEAVKPRVLEVSQNPVSTADLQERVPFTGKLMVAVRLMAYEGLILRVGTSPRSDNWSYVATESWLGGSIENADPDSSLAWLAGAYLRGFGPARVEDFAWWAGTTKTRATVALGTIETVDVGAGLLLPGEFHDEWERTEPIDPDHVAVLPKWDALTMAYRADGRARFIREEFIPVAYGKSSATTGDGLPLVLRGGRAVAIWSHRFTGDDMQVTISAFDQAQRLDWLEEHAFNKAAEVLGANAIRLHR